MDIQMIPLSELNPAPYNPRRQLKPGDSEYEKIKQSIERFSLVEPIVWNKRTGHIVGGHQRYAVLVNEGYTETHVSVVDLDENEEKALNIALNKIEGEWDNEKLTELLADLQTQDFDVTLTGFDQEELDRMFAEIKPEAVTLKKVDTKPPPKMSWVLIGIPTVRFGEIAEQCEKIGEVDGIIFETTVNDG